MLLQPLRVLIAPDSVTLERPAATSLDRSSFFTLDLSEVDNLVAELRTVKSRAATKKRVAAQRLLTEAEQLDPSEKGA